MMTTLETTTTAPRAWPMYRALVGTGLLCGLLLVGAFEITKPIILRNQIEARRNAILAVLPGARTSATFRLAEDGGFAPGRDSDVGGDLVFAGYDDQDRLVGVAVETQAMGYQDVVRVLYGYAPDRQAIIGIQVLESRETPGLGTRIETDPAFLRNFEQLDVSLDEAGTALRHAITLVKSGGKSHPWQIDGITGATISSKAVATMLAASAATWIPTLAKHAPTLGKNTTGSDR